MAFSISPANNNDGIINFATTNGMKRYEAGIKSLYDKEFYDLSSERLRGFLTTFQNRIIEQNWQELFTVTAEDTPRRMTTEFGMFTMTETREKYEEFIVLDNRMCQDDYMAYQALFNSLTEEAKTRINLKSSQFVVNARGSGLLLMRTIIDLAYVVNHGTTMRLREQLSRLDVKMRELHFDVISLNEHVETLVATLASFGETTTDLLPNILRSYDTVPDEAFKDWVRRMRNNYEEGLGVLEPTQLMKAAQDKFTSIKDRGEWNQISKTDEEIIALKAEIAAMKKTSKLSKASKATQKSETSTKMSKKKKYQDPWLFVPPDDGKDSKTVDDKVFFWCKYHKKWSPNPKHTSQTCTKQFEMNDETPPASNMTPGLKLRAALATVKEASDSDDE
jgi:hypothetical protein